MKVLHITNALGRYNSGGIGDVLNAFVSAQNKIVEKIEVWHPNNASDSEEFAEQTGLNIEQVKSFKTVGGNKNGFSPEMILEAFKKKDDFDIIHQHGLWLPISFVGLLFHSKTTKKVISPHGFLNENALAISPIKKKLSAKLYENRNLRSSDCLHACSVFEADFFRAYGLKQDIALIPNGVEDDFVYSKGNTEAFKLKHEISDNKVMLFLSRIHPSKGLELLLRLIASVKDEFNKWRLVVAGIDELNHEAELKNLAKELEIDHLIKFVGPVFGQEKVDAFDASDVFVLPTDTENFGIVVAQALARKKPVITTTEAPWKELVDFSCGWWIPKTEVAFKDTLNMVLKLPAEELEQRGRNGFNLVKKNYLWSELTHRTIELYDYLLNPSLGKPTFIL
ncbi:MAG: glycosyltransferase [Saprospiraceae bacterium]